MHVENSARRIRTQMGMSRVKAAQMSGIAIGTLENVEKGRLKLTDDRAEKLSRVYGVSARALQEPSVAPPSSSEAYSNGPCYFCGTNIKDHKKCKLCRVLLHPHGDKYKCTGCGVQHSQASEEISGMCVWCEKRYKNTFGEDTNKD